MGTQPSLMRCSSAQLRLRADTCVSRSGSTLTAALALGFKREEAARFSFLLGLPAIALAGFKELWELHKVHLDSHGWSVLAVGLLVASLSAFFAIWGLMRVLERYSAWPFVVYRSILGVMVLAGIAMGWLSLKAGRRRRFSVNDYNQISCNWCFGLGSNHNSTVSQRPHSSMSPRSLPPIFLRAGVDA